MTDSMGSNWNTTALDSAAKVETSLLELKARRWLCRGQSQGKHRLIPSIDRHPGSRKARLEKLELERRSIGLFRSAARAFAGIGEEQALRSDLVALMVMRHYGVPTRLLDWSRSPYVAAFFATSGNAGRDGAIWAFDHDSYVRLGAEQWKKWPETTTDLSGTSDRFSPEVTAFNTDEPPDWFVCQFYEGEFPRQQAQLAFYSLTARFDRDHADAIARLLVDRGLYHRYVIPAAVKDDVIALVSEHGVTRASLYPDSAGAAETVRQTLMLDYNSGCDNA